MDSMVRRDYRGKKKGAHLFIELIHRFGDECAKEDREAVVFGLTNEIAFTIGTKLNVLYRYIPITEIIYLTKNLKKDSSLTKDKNLKNNYNPSIHINQIDEFGSETREIWNTYRDNYATTIIKDQNYLNWRYCKCPDIHYFKFLIHVDNAPIGYVVMKDSFDGERHNFPDERLGAIIDWIVPRTYEKYYNSILAFCESWASDKEINRLLIMFPKPSREYQFLRGMGYEEFITRYKLVGRTYTEEITLEELNKSWFYTLGDFDIV